jgi:hypothetical protein
MTKRFGPKAAFDASDRTLQQALRNGSSYPTPIELRTTFSINRDIHDTLRLLAVRYRCKLNDLVAIAIEDLIEKQGALPGDVTRRAVRSRLATESAPGCNDAEVHLRASQTVGKSNF